MFMDKNPEIFYKLKSDAEVLLNEKDSMDADEYEQALLTLTVNVINANSSCQLYKEELDWFTERFGLAIHWIPWI
jgi:hypothetical protein